MEEIELCIDGKTLKMVTTLFDDIIDHDIKMENIISDHPHIILNSSYQNYYNILHIIPKLILSFTSIVGGIIVFRKKGFLQYLSIYFFSNILFFSIFFILPRYSLILMPIQILLSVEFFKYFLRKFFN